MCCTQCVVAIYYVSNRWRATKSRIMYLLLFQQIQISFRTQCNDLQPALISPILSCFWSVTLKSLHTAQLFVRLVIRCLYKLNNSDSINRYVQQQNVDRFSFFFRSNETKCFSWSYPSPPHTLLHEHPPAQHRHHFRSTWSQNTKNSQLKLYALVISQHKVKWTFKMKTSLCFKLDWLKIKPEISKCFCFFETICMIVARTSVFTLLINNLLCLFDCN